MVGCKGMQIVKRIHSPPVVPFVLAQLIFWRTVFWSFLWALKLTHSLSSFAAVFPGCQVYDFGDLNFTQVPNDELYNNLILYPRSVGLASQVLADAVSRAVAAGHSCVTIGGDHRWAEPEAISGACCRLMLRA